ncbi:MAG TPA: MraY family glycosyltransferase [Candidatus Saccharimonadales bacterium]|nr:MraY family glycosyltransferase [Candidatus Saccharimonadales bacterium]
MTYPIDLFILPFLLSFAVTAITTPISIFFLKKMKIVDDPKLHKHPAMIHKVPIPRGGGIPLFLGALIAGLVFLPKNTITIALFWASFIALFIGVVDDFLNSKSRDSSPYLRFLINIITALIIVGSGVSIHFITNPFGGGILHLDAMRFPIFNFLISDMLTVFWLVWVMNMINWSKGVDGQMPGIVAISAIVIGVLSLRLNPTDVGIGFLDVKLSFIIAGSAIGFLLFNFFPAKIFPGYGATGLYLLLGVTSILSSAKLATAVLVMGVPLVDFVFTIVRRIASKSSPFKGDDKHLHHLFLKLGYNQRQVALFYWCLSAILGIISLTLDAKSKVFALIMLIVITGGILFFLHSILEDTNEKTIS